MELDVTHMVEAADEMIELSGSRMEHGENAGTITWNNSKEYGREHPLLTTDDQRDEARDYFRASAHGRRKRSLHGRKRIYRPSCVRTLPQPSAKWKSPRVITKNISACASAAPALAESTRAATVGTFTWVADSPWN